MNTCLDFVVTAQTVSRAVELARLGFTIVEEIGIWTVISFHDGSKIRLTTFTRVCCHLHPPGMTPKCYARNFADRLCLSY